MQNWLHVEKSLGKRQTRKSFCRTNLWEEQYIFWTQEWLRKSESPQGYKVEVIAE
jgi:hypothetical protein